MAKQTDAMICETLKRLIQILALDERLVHRPTLWADAQKIVRTRAKNRGYFWAAIGLDHAPCSMGCKFCSFAIPWTSITRTTQFSADEVEEKIIRFIDAGADFIVLRTGEHYSLERLLELGCKLAPRIHPHGQMIANTGSHSIEGWRQLKSAGFDGIYKTVRIREGIDTPFARAERIRSILDAKTAGLNVYSLVEPVGSDHTAKELAEAIITLRDVIKPSLTGVMARVPVAGSPMESLGQVDDEYMADLTAIVVLSILPSLEQCGVVCSHPPSAFLVQAGANALVVEMGANPRDTSFASTDWKQFTIDDARHLLESEGYQRCVSPKSHTRKKTRD